MNMERQLREEERIRAGYYQQHNYTWQYVLQPEEYQDLLSREVNGKHLQIYPFHPKNNWTDFIRFKEGPAGGDCDSSAATMLTFKMVYTYLNDGEIIPQSKKYNEYQIKKAGAKYCGDTITSGWTPLKRYLAYQHQALQNKNHELFDDFDKWVKVKYDGVPMTNFENDCKRGFRDYCYYFAEQMAAPVGRVLSSDCKLFLENVWNQGNLLPVPEFFNKARASDEYGDTIDRMLTYLYYFIMSTGDDKYLKSGGNDKYLKLLFCVDEKKQKKRKKDIEEAKKATKAVKKTKDWIRQVCGEKTGEGAWNTFVEIHFLQPFCNLDKNGIYIPVCMFNNQPLRYTYPPYYEKQLHYKKQLRFLPGTLEECECFFRTCNTAILERSRLIQEKIKKRYNYYD